MLLCTCAPAGAALLLESSLDSPAAIQRPRLGPAGRILSAYFAAAGESPGFYGEIAFPRPAIPGPEQGAIGFWVELRQRRYSPIFYLAMMGERVAGMVLEDNPDLTFQLRLRLYVHLQKWFDIPLDWQKGERHFLLLEYQADRLRIVIDGVEALALKRTRAMRRPWAGAEELHLVTNEALRLSDLVSAGGAGEIATPAQLGRRAPDFGLFQRDVFQVEEQGELKPVADLRLHMPFDGLERRGRLKVQVESREAAWDMTAPPGDSSRELQLPPPAGPTQARATLELEGGPVIEHVFTLEPQRHWQVLTSFTTHFDRGYTDSMEGVLYRYRQVLLPRILDRIEADAGQAEGERFRWQFTSFQAVDLLHHAPDSGRLLRALASGAAGWDAFPSTLATRLLGPETLLRVLSWDDELRLLVGRGATYVEQSDEPGYNRYLPAILAGSGIDLLHVGANRSLGAPNLPPLFAWRAPSGAAITVQYDPGYNPPFFPVLQLAPLENHGYSGSIYLNMVTTVDNEGTRGMEGYQELARLINRKYASPTIRLVDPGEFATRVPPSDPRLPAVAGVLGDTWLHGFASVPSATADARRAQERLPEAETLAALLQRAGLDLAWAPAELEQGYRSLVGYFDHAFGRAANPERLLRHGSPASAFLEPYFAAVALSWEDKKHEAADALDRAAAVLRAADQTLGAAVRRRGPGLLIVNGLPWERGGWIELPVSDIQAALGGAPGFTIVDPRDQHVVPAQLEDGRLVALVRAVPATGYILLGLEPSAAPPLPARTTAAPAQSLSLEDLKVVAGEGGGLAALESSAGDWRGAAGRNLFEFQYRRYGEGSFEVRKYHLPYPGSKGMAARGIRVSGSAETIVGPARALLRWKESLALPEASVTLEWTAWPDPELGAVRLHVVLRNKPATLELEAGGFQLGAQFEDVVLDGDGGRYRPRDLVPGEGHDLYTLRRYIDVRAGAQGLAVVSQQAALVSLGGLRLLHWSSAVPEPLDPAFLLGFTNAWRTNFAQWSSGDFEFDFALVPHRADLDAAKIESKALELVRPLRALALPAGGGEWPDQRSLLELGGAVELLGVRKGPDGSNLMLLREMEGGSAAPSVCLDGAAVELGETDLRGWKVPELWTYSPKLGPWQIRAYRFE